MGFLDNLRKLLSGPGPGASRGDDSGYWIYVRCRRCGEPLRTRIDLNNDLSLADDGESYVVRKGLVGSGVRRCFQTCEVSLTFSADRREVLESEISGGEFITADEYDELLRYPPVEEDEQTE